MGAFKRVPDEHVPAAFASSGALVLMGFQAVDKIEAWLPLCLFRAIRFRRAGWNGCQICALNANRSRCGSPMRRREVALDDMKRGRWETGRRYTGPFFVEPAGLRRRPLRRRSVPGCRR